jgi:hypothetical protein
VWDLVVRDFDRLEQGEPRSERSTSLQLVIGQVTADREHVRYNAAMAALTAYWNTLQT